MSSPTLVLSSQPGFVWQLHRTQSYSVQIYSDWFVIGTVNWSDSDTIWMHLQHSIIARVGSGKLSIFASSFIGHVHHYPVTSLEISLFRTAILLVLLLLLWFLYLTSGQFPGFRQSMYQLGLVVIDIHVQVMDNVLSQGILASCPYNRKNGDSPVDSWSLVRYANSRWWRCSSQFIPIFAAYLASMARKVLLKFSTSPSAWGW